jgi:hypothetical protein
MGLLPELQRAIKEGEAKLIAEEKRLAEAMRAAEEAKRKAEAEAAAAKSSSDAAKAAEAEKAAKAEAAKVAEFQAWEAEVLRKGEERKAAEEEKKKGEDEGGKYVQLVIEVRNDPNPSKGMGVDLSKQNMVVGLVRGGLAATDRKLQVGDTIIKVDGIGVEGKNALAAMDEKAEGYNWTVQALCGCRARLGRQRATSRPSAGCTRRAGARRGSRSAAGSAAGSCSTRRATAASCGTTSRPRPRLRCTFPVPVLYLPCTLPVPSLYLPCTFPVPNRYYESPSSKTHKVRDRGWLMISAS